MALGLQAPETYTLPGVARANVFQKANDAGVVKGVGFYAYYAFCAASALGLSDLGWRLN
ncbi:MAG: hypothetical protein AVDCRST_MAG28-4162 [uncultured Rubrobacteraceae bacterium]|uniref:Uncharacterized protein n=1 Tax=uncultured Rubrobacteraceae bacterium TaxID=349277 RepID=A0A6J4RE89_9ACTN|nr:MAG: hypothetical protein AVDCRST_MAG28-4162 [uncultured Rubrobacteraceae bacterium]